MNFTHDRGLDLAVPGCPYPGSTYATVFKRLVGFRLGIQAMPEKTRLYCAPLRWRTPQRTDEHLEMQLDTGDWDEAAGKPLRFYRQQ